MLGPKSLTVLPLITERVVLGPGRVENMSRDDRSVLMCGSFGVAIAALFVAVAALTGLSEGGGSASSGESGATVVDVQLSEFAITPAAIVVPPGKVQLRVVNTGAMVHNFSIPGLEKKTADLLGGESEILDLGTLSEGVYDSLCEIAGHAASGMVATLTVTSDAGAASAGGTGANGLHGFANWQEMDRAMEIRAKAYPAKTMGERGGQILEPTIESDGTKVFYLTAKEVDWEVEPGKVAADGVSPVLTREAKGLDIVRRDWCPLAKDAGSRALDAILGGSGSGNRGEDDRGRAREALSRPRLTTVRSPPHRCTGVIGARQGSRFEVG